LFEPYPQAEPIMKTYYLPDPAQLKPLWQEKITDIFKMADIELPADKVMQIGGRAGRHTENLGHLLADLQYMQRTYPGLSW
ncbi:MAG: phenylacetate-CoA oxygenase subunit PaaI, partial [Alphaproteobacteria bacterium]|nr:phenylacetate-CoA oxygenase subunit PaaI [Alphaproteobacteria bacterium]